MLRWASGARTSPPALTWPFRKLYAEVCEPALEQFHHVLGRFCVEEGRLKQHRFHDGAFRDVVTLAMYREHGLAMVDRFTSLAMPQCEEEGVHNGDGEGEKCLEQVALGVTAAGRPIAAAADQDARDDVDADVLDGLGEARPHLLRELELGAAVAS